MASPGYQIESILFDTTTIQHRVQELGDQISADYSHGVTLIGILTGALYFLTDLSRAITCPVEIDLISVASYTGTESSGTVTLLKDLDREISGQQVIIVEDIVDTGRTLNTLLALLADRNPASLRVCTLLDKPDRRVVPVPIDYCGFTIPDKFVVGYGLDYNQAYRNLPYIAILT
ncbi:MAG: hypoxanthine phosphoribosyltransferase [Candidatus Latescibacteria bacterium]|nr:hypoxanthine phosphoribosyltransferase [Candidatus Latescibacterota bacterium]